MCGGEGPSKGLASSCDRERHTHRSRWHFVESKMAGKAMVGFCPIIIMSPIAVINKFLVLCCSGSE